MDLPLQPPERRDADVLDDAGAPFRFTVAAEGLSIRLDAFFNVVKKSSLVIAGGFRVAIRSRSLQT